MRGLKRLLKRTPVYALVKAARARRQRARLARWEAFDERLLAFYRGFLEPGDLCFDVGANVGNRVKVFLALGARVVAVEPQRDCVKMLKALFGAEPRFTLVEKALGGAEGVAEIRFSDANTITASLSTEWIDAVGKSGRFEQEWSERHPVALTTLDALVAQYGVPAFLKIDVEGFEHEVLKGLSRPVKALSLEFTPELIDTTFRCLEHLEQLGRIECNYSLEESMRFARDAWVSRREMVEILSGMADDHRIYGDVYVRFLPGR